VGGVCIEAKVFDQVDRGNQRDALLRKQRRRLKTPAGVLLAVVGLIAIGSWMTAIVMPGFRGGASSGGVGQMPFGAGLMMFTVLTISSALGHRGLFMPASEIELLLAAPVSRSQLIRYRLLAALGRSIFGALVLSALATRRAPVGSFGFAGTFVTVMTLPILGQAVSLAAGDAENRLATRLARFPYRWVNLAIVIGLIAGAASLTASSRPDGSLFGAGTNFFDFVFDRPLVRAILLPFTPWSAMISAESAATFWPWFAFCASFALVGFELVARCPVDFRELSLATSADVARRLNRMRRGTAGASSISAPKHSAGWRVPWLFGRGPFGAMCWRKSASILRKARSSLTTGLVIIGFVTLASILLAQHGRWHALGGTAWIIGLGTPYLCGALRFDFREDLDAMNVIKAWPIAPWRVFVATLAPEVALVSALIIAAICARMAFTRDVPIALAPCLLAVPLIVMAWASIDNAAFLFAPVRLAPGQDSLLQNAGRALLLLMLRVVVLGFVGSVVGVAVWLAFELQSRLELTDNTVAMLAAVPGLAVLLGEVVALVFVGGWMLRRFDVSRDRG